MSSIDPDTEMLEMSKDDEIARLSAENAKLREALKPLAAILPVVEDTTAYEWRVELFRDHKNLPGGGAEVRIIELTAADVRKAAAVLKG